jgi:hypothetical protein
MQCALIQERQSRADGARNGRSVRRVAFSPSHHDQLILGDRRAPTARDDAESRTARREAVIRSEYDGLSGLAGPTTPTSTKSRRSVRRQWAQQLPACNPRQKVKARAGQSPAKEPAQTASTIRWHLRLSAITIETCRIVRVLDPVGSISSLALTSRRARRPVRPSTRPLSLLSHFLKWRLPLP